jgi:hypothetical protein
MLAVLHPSSSPLQSIHPGVMDESGTINPAALNTPGKLRLPRYRPGTRRIILNTSPRANSAETSFELTIHV